MELEIFLLGVEWTSGGSRNNPIGSRMDKWWMRDPGASPINM